MARTYSNEEKPRWYFVDSLQLTNWVLESGATCHMTPEISVFIPVSMVETDNYIKVADGHSFTEKQTQEVQKKCVIIMENPSLLRYKTYY